MLPVQPHGPATGAAVAGQSVTPTANLIATPTATPTVDPTVAGAVPSPEPMTPTPVPPAMTDARSAAAACCARLWPAGAVRWSVGRAAAMAGPVIGL